jgi:hypothetical protein
VNKIQLLGLVEGQILGSLVILVFSGIIMEKRYVSWWSVGGNIGGLILTFTTLDLNPLVIIALTAYASVGVVCAIKRWSDVYVLFGSKTYGSALLTLGLFSIGGSYAWINSWFMSSIPEIGIFLIFWIIFTIFAFIIGYFVRKRIDNKIKNKR